MTSVGAYEAKTHLAQLLNRVSRGETITIAKHGVPIAMLCPVKTISREERARAIADLLAFRTKYSLEGLSIREMIEEGRR